MQKKSPKIVSLSAALAALAAPAVTVPDPAEAKTTEPGGTTVTDSALATAAIPNQLVSVGEDFLGFIVTKAADGTVLAQHVSHYSHSSHASHVSHRSHYSSSE